MNAGGRDPRSAEAGNRASGLRIAGDLAAEARGPDIPGFGPERCRMYLEGTADAPPREQLLEALRICAREPGPPTCGTAAAPGTALDVGCGTGKEVVELLRAGWRVVAIEPYPEMLARARARVAEETPDRAARVEFRAGTLEDLAAGLAPQGFGLVHAGFVLPFVQPSRFSEAFGHLARSIAPGGIFVGQFFGPRDEFIATAAPGTMTSHAAEEVRSILDGFDVLAHDEVERDGQVGRGRAKHWHVHHVLARRAGPAVAAPEFSDRRGT